MAFSDIIGNIQGFFQLGIGGNRLKNTSTGIASRNALDTADAQITASQLNNSGNTVILNSGATQSGNSWNYAIATPTGMTSNLRFGLPAKAPSIGQTLVAADILGNLVFQNLDSPEDKIYSFQFNSGATIPLFSLPIGAIVKNVTIFIDTPFSGFTTGTPPTISVGISGNTSLFMKTTDNDLADVAQAKSYVTNPSVVASNTTQNLIATYVQNSASAGAGRILVEFSVPSS